MNKSNFYYELPPELIAQTPLSKRDASRLLHLDKQTGQITHGTFDSVVDLLTEGDTLILNDSRVIPARIYGVKEENGTPIEFLMLTQRKLNTWEVLCKPGKKAKEGVAFSFGDGLLEATVQEVLPNGNRLCSFAFDQTNGETIYSVLEKIGEMPLPHYIHEKLTDNERYQTVYARERGSVAAPTAGLHFTPELLDRIRDKGVHIGFVTLHVGVGTFRPVKEDDITKHQMHAEHYEVSKETADLINRTKEAGKRVICVGTTSCRTLESAALYHGENGKLTSCDGWTEIFIYPGYEFRVMDGLITNFHLPESTLIMLVSAFAGYDATMNAYREAVKERYRFFSFGDAMFIR